MCSNLKDNYQDSSRWDQGDSFLKETTTKKPAGMTLKSHKNWMEKYQNLDVSGKGT